MKRLVFLCCVLIAIAGVAVGSILGPMDYSGNSGKQLPDTMSSTQTYLNALINGKSGAEYDLWIDYFGNFLDLYIGDEEDEYDAASDFLDIQEVLIDDHGIYHVMEDLYGSPYDDYVLWTEDMWEEAGSETPAAIDWEDYWPAPFFSSCDCPYPTCSWTDSSIWIETSEDDGYWRTVDCPACSNGIYICRTCGGWFTSSSKVNHSH